MHCSSYRSSRRTDSRRSENLLRGYLAVLPGDRFERLEDDLGLDRGDVQLSGCDTVVDGPVDVLEGVDDAADGNVRRRERAYS